MKQNDMQSMLTYVNEWCLKWRLSVNELKSKVVHFRKENDRRSDFEFRLGRNVLHYVDR